MENPRIPRIPGLPGLWSSAQPVQGSKPIAGPKGSRPLLLIALSMIPLIYSVWCLAEVARAGDIGLNCVLGIEIKEAIPVEFDWSPSRPVEGDRLIRVGDRPISHFPAYVEAKRTLRDRVGETVEVEWSSRKDGSIHRATATVRSRPLWMYLWSLLWFAQEMVIFVVAARVFWKRPRDESAQLFFWLCIVTVGAYMGGYHWSEIVVEPILIYLFAVFAVFVPVVSLHFYLVFPRINPFFERKRSTILAALYGVPLGFIAAIWWCMSSGSQFRSVSTPAAEAAVLAALVDQVAGLRLYRALRRGLRPLHRLPERELSVGLDPCRAEPDLLDLARLPAGDPADRLPALDRLVGARQARAFERGMADVCRVAALFDGVRAEHHSLQALAGRGDL